VTWHCRACGQVGRVLQVANLRPDPAPPVLEPDPEPPRPPDPEPAPPAVGLMESLLDVWTGETSKDRAAAAARVPRDLLEGIDAAADQVARETRAPRRGNR